MEGGKTERQKQMERWTERDREKERKGEQQETQGPGGQC